MVPTVRGRDPLTMFRETLDEILENRFFSLIDRDIPSTMWPRVDIAEEEESYLIKADLPGLTREDITVSVEGNALIIGGEKKEEKHEIRKGRYGHYERRFGRFTRSFNLPDYIEPSSIKAHYRDGVLEVSLRKKEGQRPKSIEVKVD